MPKAVFRFYEELNELLPKHRRKKDFEVKFEGRRSVKDMIEAFGVPHTEVDLILANGESVNFSYIVQDRVRISVYPVFESLNIENVTRLRTLPLRRTKFIADVNLGDIVKYLRVLGFDVFFDQSIPLLEIIAVSKNQNRVILTKSKNFLKHREVSHGILIRPGTTAEQIKHIVECLDIKDRIRPFTRCLVCNTLLTNVPKSDIEDRIPQKTKAFCEKYTYCENCDKIYWEGKHYLGMKNVVDEILAQCS